MLLVLDDPATTENYALSVHCALPIYSGSRWCGIEVFGPVAQASKGKIGEAPKTVVFIQPTRKARRRAATDGYVVYWSVRYPTEPMYLCPIGSEWKGKQLRRFLVSCPLVSATFLQRAHHRLASSGTDDGYWA